MHHQYFIIIALFATTNFLGVDANAARREFLSYCLSLMRAHNGEHLDSLPILDVSALKHVAYVFDALIYYMRSGSSNDASETEGVQMPSWNEQVVIFNRITITNVLLNLFYVFRMKTKMTRAMKNFR